MQLSHLLVALGLPLLMGANGASACSLALGTGGTLALSGDATRLASTEPGGIAATFTVLNLSLTAATVTVSAPQWVGYPAGFNVGAAQLAVAYTGSGVLGGVSQGYTGGNTQFNVPGLLSLAVLITVNNRISSAGGFASGTYSTRTVVTCSS